MPRSGAAGAFGRVAVLEEVHAAPRAVEGLVQREPLQPGVDRFAVLVGQPHVLLTALRLRLRPVGRALEAQGVRERELGTRAGWPLGAGGHRRHDVVRRTLHVGLRPRQAAQVDLEVARSVRRQVRERRPIEERTPVRRFGPRLGGGHENPS